MKYHTLKKLVLHSMLLASFVVLYSCEGLLKWEAPEKTYELPPITTTGETTFGCHVNGELWLFGGVGFYPKLTSSYYRRTFYLYATRDYNKISDSDLYEDSSIGIKLKNPSSQSLEGKYILGDTSSQIWANFVNIKYPLDDPAFYTDSNATGVVEILKHDTVKRIVSGLFEFRAVYLSRNDSIVVNDTFVITDGRFDVTY